MFNVSNGQGLKDMDLSYPKLVEARTVLVEKQVMMIVGLSTHATEDKIIPEFKHNALDKQHRKNLEASDDP